MQRGYRHLLFEAVGQMLRLLHNQQLLELTNLWWIYKMVSA